MTDEEDVRRLAALAGLTIDPAYLAGVAKTLDALRAQGDMLATPLAAEIEPAPVFRP
jgi:hypothetical protein